MNTPPAQVFGPYSPVRAVNGFYFVSGQIGVDPITKLASEEVREQTRQALENLHAVLLSVGLGFEDVVKTSIFVTDMGDFAVVNEVYTQFFPGPRPARSCVSVKELPRLGGDVALKVEIEAIACQTKKAKT